MRDRQNFNRFMRDYMRLRTGAMPLKDINAPKFEEFRAAVLTGGHGSIQILSSRLGVSHTTGYRWLRKIRRVAREGQVA